MTLAVGLASYLILAYWLGSQNFDESIQGRSSLSLWIALMGAELDMVRHRVDVLWCVAIVAGGVIMAALLALRKRYPRFPLPPICFIIVCLATVVFKFGKPFLSLVRSPINFIWGPMLIAYLIKKILLRFGGMDLYVRFQPAGLGLIVSQAIMIVFWNIFHVVVAPPNTAIFTGVFQ